MWTAFSMSITNFPLHRIVTIQHFPRGFSAQQKQRGRYDDPLEILLIQFYIVVTRSHVQIPRVPPRPSNSNKHLSGPRDDFSQVENHRLGLPVLLRYFLSI